jgi:hypothetical protein
MPALLGQTLHASARACARHGVLVVGEKWLHCLSGHEASAYPPSLERDSAAAD